MKQPYVVAMIAKDAVEKLPKVVPMHEVPVLMAVHGEDKVFVDEHADLPQGLTEVEFDPEDEYNRLQQGYGFHKETGQSFVALAYGGFNGFADAMAEAEEGAPRKRRGSTKAVKPAGDDKA